MKENRIPQRRCLWPFVLSALLLWLGLAAPTAALGQNPPTTAEQSGRQVLEEAQKVDDERLPFSQWQRQAMDHLLRFPDWTGNARIRARLDAPQILAELKTKPIELRFQALDGRQIDLAQLRGKVVLLDFWATWCRINPEIVPHTIRLHHQFHAQGLEVIGVSGDEDVAKVKNYMEAKGMTWPTYFNKAGFESELCLHYNIHLPPERWLINKQGKVVFKATDMDKENQLDLEIRKLLAE